MPAGRSSAAAAVTIAVRAVADEPTARLVAPFVAVAPTAIWIAVSADGYFAGSPRGLLRCWRWRYAVWFGFRAWSPPGLGCCSAGRCFSITGWR
ncbi:hypothetical protein I553_2595 [Mycobacterium xenopi 4042]|uniref:Uncharacterized protein n=1 Tax=Mycobacterium xenopi 4042 TaxID=1299334 RepID=X8CAC8_MYCXE|nr:hypothetical protein I553_2595 [Mycobacterium xenopi 4042]